MSPADNTPDFDSMSPEEIMKWMESLAKRQGASEGFTTSADMDVAEIDPSTVVIDEPGYVPYGQENKQPEPAKPAPAAASAPLPAAPPAPKPAPQPIAAPAPPAAAPAPAASAATPDFDNMSPDEIMKWMESLAKRQGAVEGFTTAADMEVAEIDPDTVQIDEPGYVPYGQENKKPEEVKPAPKPSAPKPQPAAAAPPPPAPVPVTPIAPASSPIAAPAPAASAATPDFDNMSPDEIMKWMESLAKRQGAVEGFTTAADMEVEEIDPDSVVIDEPGYVPFGQEGKPVEIKPAASKPTPAAPSTPAPSALPALESLGLTQPAASAPPVGEDALSWLEKLAADQGGADLGGLDLGGLGDIPSAAPPVPAADTLSWLENLSTGSAVDLSALEPAAPTPPAPVVGDDPMAWLENLARQQGAATEELTTPAAQSAPRGEQPEFALDSLLAEEPVQPNFAASDDPAAWLDALAESHGVTPPPAVPPPAPASKMAAAGIQPEETDVIRQLNAGKEIAPDQIANFFEAMMSKAAARTDVEDFPLEDEEAEEEAPAIESGIPDWLRDSAPTELTASPAAEVPATPQPLPDWLQESAPVPDMTPLGEAVVEPPAVDMPDWLKDDLSVTDDAGLENIFAQSETTALDFTTSAPAPAMETPVTTVPSQVNESFLNTDDQWIKHFELEYQERVGQVSEVPLTFDDHEAPAAVVTPAPTPAAPPPPTVVPAAAVESDLPEETELPVGEPTTLPAWLQQAAASAAPAPAAAAPAAPLPDWLAEPQQPEALPDWLATPAAEPEPALAGDLPDWLKEASVHPEAVPDWLMESISDEQVPVVAAPVPAPAPAAPPPAPVPVPVPVRPAPPANIAAAFASARQKVSDGDLDGALADYESVVRAAANLNDVVDDLRSLMSRHKDNPAVYRVLGDALMRNGNLQEALDTYRKALNLL